MKAMSVLRLILRAYIGTIWILAGAGKLIAAPERSLLLGREMRTSGLLRPAIRVLSIVEVAVGLLLLAGRVFPAIPVVSAMLFASFGALRRFARAPAKCGCFGSLQGSKEVRLTQLVLWTGVSALLAADGSVRESKGQRAA